MPRTGGIRKHHQRRDRDDDLIMGASPRPVSARPTPASRPAGPGRSAHRANPTSTPANSHVELRVTGWTEKNEIPKLVGFLERHAARRSPKATKGGIPPKMIKRHDVSDQILRIHVRADDVTPFGKINGFSFASEKGSQKLTIAGPGIRSKSPTDKTTTTTADIANPQRTEKTNDTVQLLKSFLERRYDPNEKLLNLARIAEDEEVAKSGMFETVSTQTKFFPALMVVCDQTLKTAEEKREAIHSVSLSGNNLPNLDVVRNLSITLPHIKALDLSGNKFASLSDLKPWKFRFKQLEHLILELPQPGWEQEILSWFPKLRILNGLQVRPDATTAPSTSPPPAALPPASPALTAEQEAMITFVQEATKLKRELAVQCLEAGNWNIDTAAQLFNAQKDNLPADSFM